MYKLLVPVDGSTHADRAVRHVITLHDRGLAIEVLMLNVQPEVVDWQTHGLARDAMAAQRDYLCRQATENARNALDAAGIAYRLQMELGEPAQSIAAIANREHCEAIVMGTRGMSGLPGIVLGSVANKVVHIVDVPVTLVK